LIVLSSGGGQRGTLIAGKSEACLEKRGQARRRGDGKKKIEGYPWEKGNNGHETAPEGQLFDLIRQRRERKQEVCGCAKPKVEELNPLKSWLPAQRGGGGHKRMLYGKEIGSDEKNGFRLNKDLRLVLEQEGSRDAKKSKTGNQEERVCPIELRAENGQQFKGGGDGFGGFTRPLQG